MSSDKDDEARITAEDKLSLDSSVISDNKQTTSTSQNDADNDQESSSSPRPPVTKQTTQCNISHEQQEQEQKQEQQQQELPQVSDALSNESARVPTSINQEDKIVLRDKMKDLFAKIITDIDSHVLDVSESQCELDSQLDRLIATLGSIKIDEKLTTEISENARRISSLKSRLTIIHTILSDSSARCSRTLAACGAAMNASTSSRSPSITSSPTASLNKSAKATTSDQRQ